MRETDWLTVKKNSHKGCSHHCNVRRTVIIQIGRHQSFGVAINGVVSDRKECAIAFVDQNAHSIDVVSDDQVRYAVTIHIVCCHVVDGVQWINNRIKKCAVASVQKDAHTVIVVR